MSSPTEGTPLLVGLGLGGLAVDEAALDTELAMNWGWILTGGILSLVGGIFALISPAAATVIAVTFMASAMIVIGAFSILGICWTEQCYRAPALMYGAVLLALGICMSTHIIESIVILTAIVAVLYMIMGIFQCSLACSNPDMPNKFSYLASGICAILFSTIVWSAFPSSSIYTLGIILGVNWVINGIHRIALGFAGSSTAKSLMVAGGSNV